MKFAISVLLEAVDQVTAPLKSVTGAVSQFQNSFEAASKKAAPMAEIATGLSVAGAQMSDMGHQILNAFEGPIQVGQDFQAKISEIGAVTGATVDEINQLSATARQLGATTSFSASQAADAMIELSKAGMNTNQVISATPGLLDLAKAGGLELGAAATIASDTMNQFGMQAKDMGTIADVLAQAANASTISVQDLGDTFKYVGPVASSAGMSLQQTAAMAALLGNAGIKGSTAGTSLSAIINHLANVTPKASSALAKLGVTTTEVGADGVKRMRDIPTILSEMSGAMAGMGNADKIQTISAIFGNDASTLASMLKMMDMGSGAISDIIGQMNNATGAAKKMGDAMGNNLKGSFAELDSAKEELQLVAFDAIKEPLREIVQLTTKVVGTIGDWARENPGLAKGVMIVGAGLGIILVGLGGLLSIGGMIAGSMVAMSMASTMLAGGLWAAVAPLLPFVLGALAIGAAIALIIIYWDEIVGAISAAWNWFRNFFNGLPGIVKIGIAVLFPFIGIPMLIIEFWDPLKNFFVGLWTTITGAFTWAWNWLTGWWNGLSTETQNYILGLLSIFAPFIGLPLLIANNWGSITTFFSGMWEGIKNTFSSGLNWIVSKVQSISSMLPEWAQGAFNWLVGIQGASTGAPVMGAPSPTAPSATGAPLPSGTQVLPQNSYSESVQKQEVLVKFDNLPKGTRVDSSKTKSGLDLDMGYSNV